MSHQDETKQKLIEIERAADRKMAEIQNALAPAQPVNLSPAQLAALVGRQLQAADPEQRQILSLKTAIAVADLMDLGDSLQRQLDEVSEELNRLKGHGNAAAAYGRWLGSLPASPRH